MYSQFYSTKITIMKSCFLMCIKQENNSETILLSRMAHFPQTQYTVFIGLYFILLFNNIPIVQLTKRLSEKTFTGLHYEAALPRAWTELNKTAVSGSRLFRSTLDCKGPFTQNAFVRSNLVLSHCFQDKHSSRIYTCYMHDSHLL